ncbi:expressed unknown protein [Seminavis robusta]|uniref:tRNAHis guanylyltransferase catalytic domain-containing protein n=1 Tax=Seminavis robusta TaxID=568900 RepID=A0A9N8DGA5_9STRA|nr:expressed unknown protein [Seminavis robusta]|eukprot:Sro76_g041830.1 n/a (351) ;mRNA; r:125872-126924
MAFLTWMTEQPINKTKTKQPKTKQSKNSQSDDESTCAATLDTSSVAFTMEASSSCSIGASMEESSQTVLSLLKEETEPCWDNVSLGLNPMAPSVPKQDWTVLGDALKEAEQATGYTRNIIPSDKWISLRCSGMGFSKLFKHLQKLGVFSKRQSPEFAAMMRACCEDLMTKFDARCAHTQSDEITVLLPPHTDSCQDDMSIQKLCSMAAASVTARFNFELMALCTLHSKKKGLLVDLMTVMQCLPTFDCQVGVFDTSSQALSLILWRAHDCSTNAVALAVHNSGLPGAKQMVEKHSSPEQMQWLNQRGLLPLPVHQRDGTFMVQSQTKQPIQGDILQLYKEGTLFPANFTL